MMRTFPYRVHVAALVAVMLVPLTNVAQESMKEVGTMTESADFELPEDRDWAKALILSWDGKTGLKAGQRKLLQKLKADPEFAAEWNQQVEAI